MVFILSGILCPPVRVVVLLYGCRWGISLFYVISLLVLLTLLLGGANVLVFCVQSSYGGCCSLVWLLMCCLTFLCDCFGSYPYPAYWGELTFNFLYPVFVLYFVHSFSSVSLSHSPVFCKLCSKGMIRWYVYRYLYILYLLFFTFWHWYGSLNFLIHFQ